MRLFIICAFLIGIGTGATCAQIPDSIATKQLEEVIVNAKTNTTNANGVYFVPSNKQKTSAQDGIDLLRRMSIPQIKVGLTDNIVTTPSGNSVAIFINFVLASPEELEGLKTTDVRRVEYFFSPSDQRFMGERNVINIIVQPYIYGGYTKLSLAEKFFIGLSSNASVYSKFSYKKMTYDVFIGSRNVNNHHNSNSIQSEYFVIDNENGSKPTWINRAQIPERSHYIQNVLPISFRASYSKKGFQMKHSLSFTFKETPHNITDGARVFTPMIFSSQSYTIESSSRTKTLSYNGNFNFNLPKQFYLTLSPKASYSHNNQYYHYTSSTDDIINNASEDNYSASLMGMSRKIVGDVHYLFLRAFGGTSEYKVVYSGNSVFSDNMRETYLGAAFQYGYYTDRISVDFLLGVRCERNTTNAEAEKEFYPYANMNFGWSPNQRHSLNLSLSYSK